ncbi:MAG: LPXTG cell wall anchor domain-containing protein [Frankia sp.]
MAGDQPATPAASPAGTSGSDTTAWVLAIVAKVLAVLAGPGGLLAGRRKKEQAG